MKNTFENRVFKTKTKFTCRIEVANAIRKTKCFEDEVSFEK